MNLFITQKQMHRHIKQTNSYQRVKQWGGIYQKYGINRYTLLYTKQIKTIYFIKQGTTCNILQQLMIKGSEKEYICVYIYTHIKYIYIYNFIYKYIYIYN